MIKTCFTNEFILSTHWMIRVMNFGQDRPESAPKTDYKMVVDKAVINEVTRKMLREIKEDAKQFPEEWDVLGTIVLSLKDPEFFDIEAESKAVAAAFLLDFGYDILIALEMRFQHGVDEVDYILNSVSSVDLDKKCVTFHGMAFVRKQI